MRKWCDVCDVWKEEPHGHDDAPTLFDIVGADHEELMQPAGVGGPPQSPPPAPPTTPPASNGQPPVGPWDTIQAKFEQFHRHNPDVYRFFVTEAREYKRRGYPVIGIGHLTEILRWKRRMTTYDPVSEFKMSNSYRSRYSRLIMQQEPDLDGFITTRELKSP